MAVRSKRLYGPAAVSTSSAVIYTTPVGETTLVKWITFTSPAGAACTLTVGINGITQNRWVLVDAHGVQGESHQHSLWWVLQPGDTLNVVASTANNSLAIFGAELEGVAD